MVSSCPRLRELFLLPLSSHFFFFHRSVAHSFYIDGLFVLEHILAEINKDVYI